MINDNASPEAKRRFKNFWGQLPELPEQRAARIAAQRQARYSQEPARQLGDYIGTRRSKFEPQPNESDAAFTARLRGIGLQNLTDRLPAEELERVSKAYNDAIQRQEGGTTHEQLRTQLDQRNSGSGVGLFGQATPQQRGASYQARFERPGRSGSDYALADVTRNQAVPASMSEIRAEMDRRERERFGQEPQRVDVSTMRSSGSDFESVGSMSTEVLSVESAARLIAGGVFTEGQLVGLTREGAAIYAGPQRTLICRPAGVRADGVRPYRGGVRF